MKTKQLVARSAVTIVATGLTLLSSGTSDAHGRGPSGGRMSGGHGSSHGGAISQSISGRALARVRGGDAIGRIKMESRNLNRGRDDRGGRGERERRNGKDDGIRHDLRDDRGGRGERERERRHGQDDGRGHDARDDRGGRGEREPGDDKGRHGRGHEESSNATTAREREPGDDKGRKHREPGDDKGGRGEREPGDDKGGRRNDDKGNAATAREREPGDDHGRKHREPGDDKGSDRDNDEKAVSATSRKPSQATPSTATKLNQAAPMAADTEAVKP